VARIILVTGGSRSGKSRYARELAETLGQPRAFVATCPVVDDEIRERIARHQQARAQGGWHTIEETTDLAGALGRARQFGVVLVDCLTLWINNLMYESDQAGQTMDEDDLADRVRHLLAACRDHPGTIVFVTNEVGMGIVPDNVMARRYRDLVGRANQILAAQAHVVTLMTCGLPVAIKGV